MPIRLPGLKGAKLRDLRNAFGLSQADLAHICRCSVSAIQKAEGRADDPVGQVISNGLVGLLLSEADVMLMLSLSLEGVRAAETRGLAAWHTPVGVLHWRPLVDDWRSQVAARANRTFGSNASMAIYLAEHLQLDPEEAVLICDKCLELQVSKPDVAWRSCMKCGAMLCGHERCGQEVLMPRTDLRAEPPVLCRDCARNTLRRGSREPSLSGDARSVDLERHWARLRPTCSAHDAHHAGFMIIVEDDVDEGRARVLAVRGAVRSWGTHPTHPNLDFALEEGEQELNALLDLQRRVRAFRE